MDMKDEASLGIVIQWFQQALLLAYKNNCPLRPIRKGKKSLRWTPLLASHRREVRRLFNRGRAKNDPDSWELYREAQRSYRGEVRKVSKETWRTFCSSINNLPRAARLHRALSGDPKVRLGSLVAPTGERTQSEGETLDFLLTTHFPNSNGRCSEVIPIAACRTKGLDWRVAERI
jgi:hypothetical protein